MYDLFPIVMFIVMVCTWQFQMARKKDNPDNIMRIITFMGVTIAAIYGAQQVYDNSPRDFAINISPNTEIHICIIDGHIIFDEGVETSPNVYKMSPNSISITRGVAEYAANISVTDIQGPWWAFGRVVKPYGRQVTLITQNAPPGVDVAFENTPLRVELQDKSTITGKPPFDSKIVLKFAANSTLPYGTHYITIKGIGEDGTERTNTCVLKVGQTCSEKRFVSLDERVLSRIGHLYIGNNTVSYT